MDSKEAYEANLSARLLELRNGDPAYALHSLSVMEAIDYSTNLHRDSEPQRLADIGCGLGFMTLFLSKYWKDIIGFDISEKAIALAKAEHPNMDFHVSSAESLPTLIKELGIEPFNHAILNMVLSSVDEITALNVLIGARKSLKSEGTVLVIVPTEYWLCQKLDEYAQDQGMKSGRREEWVRDQLSQTSVALPVKISGGEYYPMPITLYNRTLDDYGEMLLKAGFSVPVDSYNGDNNGYLGRTILPYWEPVDLYLANMEMESRERNLLMSFNFDAYPSHEKYE